MSKYIETVVNASGGFVAPAENLEEQDIRDTLNAAGMLIPEEQDLADALLEIVEKHGKFNDDNTGVWAGYTSAKDNVENAAIGVKCGNCVFWQAPNGCSIIVAEAEEGGLCRFAVLPDGSVTASADETALEKNEDDPCWSGYIQVGMKEKNGKRVPNCVPSASTIDYVVASANEEFGPARHISTESAYAVARNAYEKYESLSDEEVYSAVLWELMTYAEYATTGVIEEGEDPSEFAEYISEGHPDYLESSLVASVAWVASAPELDNSARHALLNAFSDTTDYVSSLHASTRLRAVVSSGSVSDATLTHIKSLSERYSKVN